MARVNEGSPERGLPGQGWFCHHGGHERGPLDLDTLRETLRLLPRAEVLVWHSSLPEWVGPDDPRVGGLFVPPPARHADPIGLPALLFSFRGRVGRARYFWASCICSAIYVLSVMAALAYTRAPVSSDTGTLIRLALAPPLVWISSALNAKRLHDIGMSATHLLWIMPATLAGSAVQPGPMAGPLAVMGGAVELWLLLRRGVGADNPYRPSPARGRAAAGPMGAAPIGRRSSGGLIALAALAGAVAMIIYGEGPFDGLRPQTSLCSSPSVLGDVHDLIAKKLDAGDLGGVEDRIRFSLHSARTLDADSPARGSTCVVTAKIYSSSSNKFSTFQLDGSDIRFTVQYVDGSRTEYVVVIERW